MFGHDDFSKVQKLWTNFWKGKNEAPLFSIITPKNGREIPSKPPYLSWFNGNFEETADALAAWYESCEFYGAAVPCFAQSFGADDFAALIGADLSYRPTEDGPEDSTSWSSPVLNSLEDTDIRFDPKGKWWQRNVEFHDILKKRLGDTVMIATPTLSAGLDALSALYTPGKLLMDLVDAPELVHRALEQINAAYTGITGACAELFEYKKNGSINRHGMYSTGTINVPQCDFSCMISPEYFEEFAAPSLHHEFSFMDGGEYHLDGPDAVKHLERLVKIPGLDIIQWVSGAGSASQKDWTGLYRRILSLGKGLILGCRADQTEDLINKYRSNKLFIQVFGIKSKMEAEDFLYRMEKIRESGL
jgi:5-methyltetrahydrofolate--homocysteine methyltransferase